MWTNIDSIVRGELVNQGLSIHWYMPFLHLALTCVNNLQKDAPIMNNIKSVRLSVGPDDAVTIPSDYVDYVRIGKQYGGYIRPLVVNPSLNRLENNATASGAYSTDTASTQTGGSWPYYVSSHTTIHGEHTGGYYGYSQTFSKNSFRVIPERNEIQFDATFSEGDVVVLDYLSFTANSASVQVHKYAEEAIQAYIGWKYMDIQDRGRNSRLQTQNAKQDYYEAVRVMHARLTDWNIPDMMQAIRSTFRQSPKI